MIWLKWLLNDLIRLYTDKHIENLLKKKYRCLSHRKSRFPLPSRVPKIFNMILLIKMLITLTLIIIVNPNPNPYLHNCIKWSLINLILRNIKKINLYHPIFNFIVYKSISHKLLYTVVLFILWYKYFQMIKELILIYDFV